MTIIVEQKLLNGDEHEHFTKRLSVICVVSKCQSEIALFLDDFKFEKQKELNEY